MPEQAASTMVSVVIVSWNAKDYLMECLASLTGTGDARELEIIVVDNASSDGSAEIVANRFPQVRLISTGANLGFARANNLGIRSSHGRYVCLINPDVKTDTDCIRHLVDYCEGQPDIGMAGPRIIGGDGQLQRSWRRFPALGNMLCRAVALDTVFQSKDLGRGTLESATRQEAPRPVDILSGCFWVVRRKAIEEVGLLDESFFMYGEDLDWCRRFWNAGWKVAFVPSVQAIHYGGASSSNAPVRFFIERQKADLGYWRKHHSRAGLAFFFLISCLHLALRMVGYSLALAMTRKKRTTYRHHLDRSLACLRWMLGGCGPVPSTC